MDYQLLIVDDEYEIRTGLANYFPWNSVGFQVAGQCGDGKEALEFIKTHKIHAVLCDIRMPVMDGLELAKQLYETYPEIKLVFLSGYKDFDFVREALKYRAQDYILKPTKFDEITEVFGRISKELDLNLLPDGVFFPSESSTIIDTIKRIAEENSATVTLEAVSKEVYLNPFYISKLFKQRTGQNFTDYVTECRMKKAARLLADFTYKTYEISEMSGYSNPKNFARAFKKYYGLTPSDYRNLKLAKGEHHSL